MVDERSLARPLLAVLVVLAGCNFAPGGTPAPSPTPTASPTDVWTASPPADTAAREGLATDGVVNPSALATAHERVLADTNFTAQRTITERYENGSLRLSQRTTARYAANRERLHVIRSFDGAAVRSYGAPEGYEVWSNGSTTVARVNTTAGPTYRRGTYRGHEYTYRSRLLVVLSGMGSANVTLATVNGSRVYRVVDRNVSNPRLLAMGATIPGHRIDDVHDVTAAAVVRPDGQVRHAVVQFTVETVTETIEVVERIRFTDVGTTTAPEPGWVGTAINRTAE